MNSIQVFILTLMCAGQANCKKPSKLIYDVKVEHLEQAVKEQIAYRRSYVKDERFVEAYVNVDIDLNGTAGANPFGIDIRVKFLLNTVINCVLKNSREDAHISYDRVIYGEGLQQIVRKIVTTIDIDGHQLQQEEYEYVDTRNAKDFAGAAELRQMSVDYLNDYLIPNNAFTSTPFVNDVKYLEVQDIMMNE